MNDESPFGSLQGSFGQAKPAAKSAGVDYTHAQEDTLRQTLEGALGQSATGAALLQFAAQQKIITRIIKGKGTSGFISESRAVYIGLSPDLSTPTPYMVLELGAFLRQAQLHILGHKNPDFSVGSNDSLLAFDSKIVDSIAIMCKIATELKDIGHKEYVDALITSGHSELYETYSNNGMGDSFIEAYFKAVKAK